MSLPVCRIGDVEFGAGPLALIAGPCMAESRDLCLRTAERVAEIARRLGVGCVFKASYDKANRSSAASPRGPGLHEGLAWLADARDATGLPLCSDVHETAQVAPAADVLDCLQIPAFLCRQTDLLVTAAGTGRAVNVKKGQFMAPWEMQQAAGKVRDAGCQNLLLTERGTFFGYNRLVTDLRSIPQMRPLAPVVFDATHSVQEPGGQGAASGGEREYVELLARAAVAAGADALFVETHPNPPAALSDAACQVPLDELEALLQRCLRIREAAR